MAWPEQGNAHRREQASERDMAIARRLLGTALLTDREVALLHARMAHPGASWQQVADQLGITKHAATGIWRRVLRRTGERTSS
jgi:DNA-binding CsgD family transcriptional regulator